MPYQFMLSFLILTCFSFASLAQETSIETVDDSVVRLPEQIQRRLMGRYGNTDNLKFVPGGALILSFDQNDDRLVSQTELKIGIDKAFDLADKNYSGYLSVFEQQEWAYNLQVKDDTLANPVRFDPNLNGSISYEEFSSVISLLAKQYENESGIIHFDSLIQVDIEDIEKDEEKVKKPKTGRRNLELASVNQITD